MELPGIGITDIRSTSSIRIIIGLEIACTASGLLSISLRLNPIRIGIPFRVIGTIASLNIGCI